MPWTFEDFLAVDDELAGIVDIEDEVIFAVGRHFEVRLPDHGEIVFQRGVGEGDDAVVFFLDVFGLEFGEIRQILSMCPV